MKSRMPFTLALLAFALPAPAEVFVTGACDGTGIQGTKTENGITINFWSCPETAGLHRKIWKANGDPMTELLYDPASGQGSSWGAGILITEALTEEEAAQIDAVLTSPEGLLAAALADDLMALGISRDYPPLACIGGNDLAYHDLIVPFYDKCSQQVRELCEADDLSASANPTLRCLGCCGASCWLCFDVCTQACLDHDCATRCNTGSIGSRIKLWFKAAGSLIGCWLHLSEEC